MGLNRKEIKDWYRQSSLRNIFIRREMPMCLTEDKNRTEGDENQTVRRTCPHRTGAQKQLSTAGAKADLLILLS